MRINSGYVSFIGDENTQSFDLVPCDSRKSFYGKANVIENKNIHVLQSYSTFVCYYNSDTREFVKLWDGYSATTMRHIESFRDHYGLSAIGKKEWEALPVGK